LVTSQLIVKTEEIDTYKSTHSLNLLWLNTHSISAKKVSFGNLISEYSPDIIAVCETWLIPDDLSYLQDIMLLERTSLMTIDF